MLSHMHFFVPRFEKMKRPLSSRPAPLPFPVVFSVNPFDAVWCARYINKIKQIFISSKGLLFWRRESRQNCLPISLNLNLESLWRRKTTSEPIKLWAFAINKKQASPTSIQNPCVLGNGRRYFLLEILTNPSMHLLCLLGCRGLSSANSPYWLIRNYNFAPIRLFVN